MKLFVIKRIGSTDYDEYDSFVVRAEDEAAARHLCPPESGWSLTPPQTYGVLPTWTDPTLSTCTEITGDGDEEVICASFNAG